MTDKELREIASSVEDLRRAIKKNNPELRFLMSGSGWVALCVAAGTAMALFCLPAQVLVSLYGSFGLVPAPYRAALWGVFALALVLAGAWKMAILIGKAREIGEGLGLRRVFTVFFTGKGLHVSLPFFLASAAASAFAVMHGHPWYIVPAIAMPTCFYAVAMAEMIGRSFFRAAAWWSLLSGIASLFFIEEAPFIWLFVVYGGFCFALGAALFIENRLSAPPPEGQGGAGDKAAGGAAAGASDGSSGGASDGGAGPR